MNAPLAEVVEHPWIKGGWTINDPMAPKGHPNLFASKQSAEAAAEARNKKRRNAK